MLYNTLTQAIGNTPLVHIPFSKYAAIYAKLEYLNPGGSIKDRSALYMIEQAEKTAAGTFEPSGKFLSLGLAEGMVGYATEDGQVTAEMQSAVEAASAEIVSGAITVADWSQE